MTAVTKSFCDKMHRGFRGRQLKPFFQTMKVCQQSKPLLLILFFLQEFNREKEKNQNADLWQNFSLIPSQLEHKDLYNVTRIK